MKGKGNDCFRVTLIVDNPDFCDPACGYLCRRAGGRQAMKHSIRRWRPCGSFWMRRSVTAEDYEVEAGSSFDVKSDFSVWRSMMKKSG